METNLIFIDQATTRTTRVPIDAATIFNPGDIMVLDAGKAVPASTAGLWDTDEATTQARLHTDFLGFAHGISYSPLALPIGVLVDGIVRVKVPAASYTIEQYLGGVKDPAGNFMYANQFAAVAGLTTSLLQVMETKTTTASDNTILARFSATKGWLNGLQAKA